MQRRFTVSWCCVHLNEGYTEKSPCNVCLCTAPLLIGDTMFVRVDSVLRKLCEHLGNLVSVISYFYNTVIGFVAVELPLVVEIVPDKWFHRCLLLLLQCPFLRDQTRD